MADEERDDRLAVHVLGDPGRRGREAQRGDSGQLTGCIGNERSVHFENGSRVFATPRDCAAENGGTDSVKLIFEAGGDAEVAAAAPQAPEEVAVLAFRSAQHLAL